MAVSNFQRCLDFVLFHEGGFVDHPADPGGATNMGVTKKAWEEYIGSDVTKEELRALTVAEITPFYRKRYWDACKCDNLHGGVDLVVFDVAVNSGPRRAAKFLQEAVGAVADGSIGPRTLAAANSFGPNLIIGRIYDRRESFFRSLPHFPTFGHGWLKRNNEVHRKALEMAAQAVR